MNVVVQVVKLLSIYLFYPFIFVYKESYRRDLRDLHMNKKENIYDVRKND